MLQAKSKKSKRNERKVTILAGLRKPSGMVCAKVRNDQGVCYFVTVKHGIGTCQCAGNSQWKKQCYHIRAVIENARIFGPEGLLADEVAASHDRTYAQALGYHRDPHIESCCYCGRDCKGGICGRCAA